MALTDEIVRGLSHWMDCVAGAISTLLERLATPRLIRLVEEEPGLLSVHPATKRGTPAHPAQYLRIVEGTVVEAIPPDAGIQLKGKRAELLLQPSRFLFRPLELPRRASDFLDGIVRAQIDRLTPWNTHDAAFGWTPPSELGNDRIVITVAATALALVAPYMQALTDIGASSIVVSTAQSEANADAPAIKVLERRGRGAIEINRIRHFLVILLVVTGLVAATAMTTAFIAGDRLDTEQADLARRISERRVALRIGRDATGATSAQRTLELHKYEVPASVAVLDALSQILPDHTYVTEMRIEGRKLQVIGVTRDAPSLIRLMEQSPLFTRATFFAPTTRAPSDPGERFHIEARIEPAAVPRT